MEKIRYQEYSAIELAQIVKNLIISEQVTVLTDPNGGARRTIQILLVAEQETYQGLITFEIQHQNGFGQGWEVLNPNLQKLFRVTEE